jgi:hypothetical protein
MPTVVIGFGGLFNGVADEAATPITIRSGFLLDQSSIMCWMNEYTLFVDRAQGLGQDAPASASDPAAAILLTF